MGLPLTSLRSVCMQVGRRASFWRVFLRNASSKYASRMKRGRSTWRIVSRSLSLVALRAWARQHWFHPTGGLPYEHQMGQRRNWDCRQKRIASMCPGPCGSKILLTASKRMGLAHQTGAWVAQSKPPAQAHGINHTGRSIIFPLTHTLPLSLSFSFAAGAQLPISWVGTGWASRETFCRRGSSIARRG